MKFYILIILNIFFITCASQGTPSGGPIDELGPVLISINPADSLINKNQSITIKFNENIDQTSVKSAITINGDYNFNLKVRYDKIIISPIGEWANINELFISRNIRDYQGNIMDAPILKIFTTNNSEIYEGEINGELLNITDDRIYEVGLYSVINGKSIFFKKVESNIDGTFRFINIPNGEYRIGAIEGKIIDFNYDYRLSRYGINSKVIRINNNQLNNIKIMIDEPLAKLGVASGYLANGNHAILSLSNGQEESFFVENKTSMKKYINGDSVIITPNYSNRLESYSLGEIKFIANYISDTLPPVINEINLNQDKLNIYFSEPIKLLGNKIFIDSNQVHINHTIIDPFRLTAKLNNKDLSEIYINPQSISDYENNSIDSLITINVPSFGLSNKVGSLSGVIKYDGIMKLVVKLVNIETKIEYFTLSNNNKFIFSEIPQGKYYLESYEKKHNNKEVYYSGIWEPYKSAAQIIQYPELIDIRAHWEVRGIEINYLN